jgi:hypothetical protein
MNQVVTPMMIEKRLKDLSHEVDASHTELADAERNYFEVKARYELALAHARLSVANKKDMKVTVSDKADLALVSTEELHMRMATAEALVRAARANASRIRTQVDIARSIGTSVRTSMDLA